MSSFSNSDPHLQNPDAPELKVTHEGEHHGDFGDVPIKITRWTYIYAFCAAVNSCNLGYDIGVSTEAGKLIQDHFNLTTFQRELFLGSMNFWSIFGALGAQYFTDKFGRRWTFIIAALGFILGVVIQSAAMNYATLMVGRFFVGLGVGTGLAIDPLYIAEVTPAKHRGELVTWSEIALNVGIVFGFSTGLTLAALDDSIEWRVMFALGLILPIAMIFLVIFVMPESPRWLVAQGREDDAREILRKVYPDGFNAEPVVQDIKEALEREEAAEHAVGWRVIFRPTPAIRRMLWVGVGIAVAQQAVGIDAIQYYLLDVLDESGVNNERKQNGILMGLGIIKLLFIFVGGRLFDRKGRRPLFLVSLLGMALALLLVSIAFFVNQNVSPAVTVTGLAFYLAFFSTGMGPGAWLIPSEVFATCIRAKAMSVATFSNRVTATLMSSTFLTTANAMGWGGFFLMLCIISLIVAAFVQLFLPETRGRSLEDMSIYFAEITRDRSLLEAEAKIADRRDKGIELLTSARSPDRSSMVALNSSSPGSELL